MTEEMRLLRHVGKKHSVEALENEIRNTGKGVEQALRDAIGLRHPEIQSQFQKISSSIQSITEHHAPQLPAEERWNLLMELRVHIRDIHARLFATPPAEEISGFMVQIGNEIEALSLRLNPATSSIADVGEAEDLDDFFCNAHLVSRRAPEGETQPIDISGIPVCVDSESIFPESDGSLEEEVDGVVWQLDDEQEERSRPLCPPRNEFSINGKRIPAVPRITMWECVSSDPRDESDREDTGIILLSPELLAEGNIPLMSKRNARKPFIAPILRVALSPGGYSMGELATQLAYLEKRDRLIRKIVIQRGDEVKRGEVMKSNAEIHVTREVIAIFESSTQEVILSLAASDISCGLMSGGKNEIAVLKDILEKFFEKFREGLFD